MTTWHFGTRSLSLHEGELQAIADAADAVVSPDDNHLTHSGGASAAIWSALALREDRPAPALSLGDVHVQAREGRGPRHVLHAVTLDFDQGRAVRGSEAAALYGRVLARAAEVNARVVALPLLGVGAARLTVAESVDGLCEAMERLADHPGAPSQVRLAVREDTVGEARAALEARPPVGGPLRALLGGDIDLWLWAAEEVVRAAAERAREAWSDVPDASADSDLAKRDGAWAWSPPLEGLPPRPILERAERIGRAAGRGLPSGVSATLWSIVVAHEALVSRTGGEGARADLTGALVRLERAQPELFLKALARLGGADLAGVAAAALGVSGFTSAGLTSGSLDGFLGRFLHRPQPTAAGPAPEPAPRAPAPEPAADDQGTAHVRKLRDFLLQNLPSDDLSDLLGRLEASGYRGERDLRLLEWCVRVPDPAQELAELFSLASLRRLHAQVLGRAPPSDAGCKALAERLLDHMGFPVGSASRGLAELRDALVRGRADATLAQQTELLVGLVTRGAQHLEYTTLVLIRFLSRAVFGCPAEVWLAKEGIGDLHKDLERASLGTRFLALDRVAKRVPSVERPANLALLPLLRKRPVAPPLATLERIAALRNAFAHDRVSTPSPATATEFFDAALAYLDYLADPDARIFPVMVRVDRIVIDRWGRRTVEGTRDDGKPEVIFTDRSVQPGEVYFMHPLSNPFRVDPVLVPRGDMWAPK